MRFWFIAESAVSGLGVCFSVYVLRALLLLLFILIDTSEML